MIGSTDLHPFSAHLESFEMWCWRNHVLCKQKFYDHVFVTLMQTCSTFMTVDVVTAASVTSAVSGDVRGHILEDCVLHGCILLVVLLMVTSLASE
jgi:hypothetical protein